ncbi:MAG: GTPase ObgE [Candidatus Nomurabacteria bacterium]|jgi:GTP-binding protein|nr:GTPase ObgE [Candidatus Nomurabacteria bacterium]
MFADTAKVSVKAGDGGRGAVSFRHEKYVDKGGPDGGDGGKGGDVVFRADPNVGTLIEFRYQPRLAAESGGVGAKQNMHGKNGANLIVKVPVGTLVYRISENSTSDLKTCHPELVSGSKTESQPEERFSQNGNSMEPNHNFDKSGRVLLADLTAPGQTAIVARGGGGGFGNAHFKSSTRQTPRVAEVGAPGEKFALALELKLLADVGLVGFPSVGKSTFLSVISSARPKIADYAFTTLTPNLGMAKIDSHSLLVADIPGLIEGASDGKGLGDDFLKHIERTSVILHLVDAGNPDVAADYRKIRTELQNYSSDLAKKPEIVALSKCDTIDDELVKMQTTELKKVVPKTTPIFQLSSRAHRGLDEILRALWQIVEKVKKSAAAAAPLKTDSQNLPVIGLSQIERDRAWWIEEISDGQAESETLQKNSSSAAQNDKGEPAQIGKSAPSKLFIIHGAKLENFAARTDFASIYGVNRLRDILGKTGVRRELERRGATGESLIQIGGHRFTLLE